MSVALALIFGVNLYRNLTRNEYILLLPLSKKPCRLNPR